MNYQDLLTFIIELIQPELLIIMITCWIIGSVLKRNDKIQDEVIPLVLFAFAVVISLIYILATTELISVQTWLLAVFHAITQGILCAGAAIGINQLIKQTNRINKQE